MFRALDAPGNLLVEATFHNPHSEPSGYWSHGFLLKDGGTNKEYWVGFKSTGDWRYFHRLGSSEQRGQKVQHSADIDTAPGASNLLQVVQVDDSAWVYINGVYQGSFSMTADTGGDLVYIYVSDKEDGTTRWEDFSVWQWHQTMYGDFPETNPLALPTPGPAPDPSLPIYGPVSGSISHDSTDGKTAVYQGPTVTGDVMLEVTFENPFAPNESHWNYGILFDDTSRPKTYHWIEIGSKWGGYWFHRRRAGPDEESRGGRSERLTGLDFDEHGETHIRLIIIGQEGWLYVNDRRAGIVPFTLGNIPNPERLRLIINDVDTGGFEYDRGGETRFEDFTVWKWHQSLFDLPKDD